MLHQRRSIRLPGYDYRTPGAYFVMLCTAGRRPWLSDVVASRIRLTLTGRVVEATLNRLVRSTSSVQLDAYVLMPDHVHLVLWLIPSAGREGSRRAPDGTPSRSLAAFLQGFKSRSAHAVHRRFPALPDPFCQRGYYEHIVRDTADLARIRRYIAANPARWHTPAAP